MTLFPGRLLAATVLAVALAAGAVVSAHPTATSFVVVTVTESRDAVVDITSDALSLVLKLEALGGGITSTSSLSTAARRARIQDLMPVLLTHVVLVSDTEPLTLVPGAV